MNTRALYIFLAVQALFAVSLIYVGARAREARRQDYLELTHRVTSGMAGEADFLKLAAHIPGGADAQTVRALFGAPLQLAKEMTAGNESIEPRKGNFWIYYVAQDDKPVSPPDVVKLAGKIRCFVVDFDEKGGGRGAIVWVVHPIEPAKPPAAAP
jgi:hypothetical protein